jgi:hypothetical protein
MTKHKLPTRPSDVYEERHRSDMFFPDVNLGQRFDALLDHADTLLDDKDAEDVLRDFLVPVTRS